MSNFLPNWNDDIIVGVIYQKKFDWYITYKGFWFLDYQKRMGMAKAAGYEVNEDYIDEERKGILILDSDNVELFLDRIKNRKVDAEWLRTYLIQSRDPEDDSWIYDFRPSLYVNFDTHELFSLYPEMVAYENYVPSNWVGKFDDFFDRVPPEQRYWISDTGKYLLEGD